MIHAPSTNFATSTTSSVTPVATAPAALTRMLATRGLPGARTQCTTMPACDSVKARKAPMAKSGISLSVIPPKTMSNRAGQDGQGVNALRIDEPTAPRRKDAGQEAVLPEQPTESWEIGEPGFADNASTDRIAAIQTK